MTAILGTPPQGASRPSYSTQSVVDRVSDSKPDLVLVGNLHNAKADPMLLNMLSQRFPTFAILHDFWLLTGRCAYTGGCEQYLTECDDTCPTPNEYPALPPAEIADAWWKKRMLLGAATRPVLLANSEWTAAFANRALANMPNDQTPLIEVFRLSFPLDLFRPRDRQACREQFGLPPDRFLVLVPAPLDETRKGARPLIEALAQLRLPNISIVTIGWRSLNVDLPIDVIQLGYINDPQRVAELNSAVDLVVAPSSAETFGQIFIEAIACGTPVAGYPVAAVPEAIQDGVTGFIAEDATPKSLAALVHYLYAHPELRRDVERWGRLYVENEWSEFSAYRYFYLALRRLGLTKSLGVRHKIGFLPAPPQVSDSTSVVRDNSQWTPRYGFSALEQAPEHELANFRWAFGPAAMVEIFVNTLGAHHLLIAYRNPHHHQRLTLRLNGDVFGVYDLAHTGLGSGRVLVENVSFSCQRNTLHLEFSSWYSPEHNSRPLAIVITDILIEEANRWDASAGVPSAQQALVAAWGQSGVTC